MIDTTPELDDEWQPTPHPLPDELVRRVAVVVNTHLHFDHCGGNRLFPGVPIHVQRRELADGRTEDDYTVREWVDFPGATYVEHDGEAEILPGVRLLPAPGHSAGHQVVVVETDEGTVVLGGDVGYSFAELARGDTEGRRLVLELAAPTYLAHVAEPRVPRRAS
jgi:N-acyl homoserine lactone hydrolase